MRSALPILLAAALAAGEAAQPVIATIELPDLERSAQRLATGPYGAIWAMPQMQAMRGALAGAADPEVAAWVGLLGRVTALRGRLAGPPGGEGEPDLALAMRVPAGGAEPAVSGQMQLRRDGEWLVLAPAEGAAAVPPAGAAGPADLRLEVDLQAIGAAMRPQDAKPYLAVIAALGLGRIIGTATADAQGLMQEVTMPGSRLPLAAVDPAALAGLPPKPIGVGAIGIDGAALVATVRAVAAAVGEDMTRADRAAVADFGLGLDALLAGLGGTWAFATTEGMPMPGMTLVAPATPATDALATWLIAQLPGADAPALAAAARSAATVLPSPRGAPVVLQVRRTATRWILTTDMLVMPQLEAERPAPFPVAATWPGATGAVALAWSDAARQAQILAGVLPMAAMAMPDPEAKRWFGLAQQALAAAAPRLPVATLVATQQGGLRVRGRNGLVMDVMPLSVAAGMALPAISMVRESARKANAASNMRQIVMAAIVYGTDNDGRWPKDLAELKKWSDGELVDKLFQSPGHPEIAEPFLYVRPHVQAKAMQPVLVQDPACNRGRGSNVCYADGHVGFVKGVALWAEAQRLAALPKAAAEGIEMADWQVDTQTGVGPGGPAPAGDPKAVF